MYVCMYVCTYVYTYTYSSLCLATATSTRVLHEGGQLRCDCYVCMYVCMYTYSSLCCMRVDSLDAIASEAGEFVNSGIRRV
jgi:hypothetical protein